MRPKEEMAGWARDARAFAFVSDGGMLRDLGLDPDDKREPPAMAAPQLAAAVVRTLSRRIALVSAGLEALESRIAALDRTVSAQRQRIGELEARVGVGRPGEEDASIMGRLPRAEPAVLDLGGIGHLFPTFVQYKPEPGLITKGLTPGRTYAVLGRDTRYVRLEGDDGKPIDIAPRFLVAVPGPANPAPSSPEFEERRRPADDFLSPPPIARAIGRAVTAAAEKIPDRKAEAAAKLRERLLGILDLLGGEAFDRLNHAIVDAQRAGVIP